VGKEFDLKKKKKEIKLNYPNLEDQHSNKKDDLSTRWWYSSIW